MSATGWVLMWLAGFVGGVCAENVVSWLRSQRRKPVRDDRRIGELEARVDGLEAVLEALARGEDTIPQSSGAMRADYKPGLPPLPPPSSPFPIRSVRERGDDLPNFHD